MVEDAEYAEDLLAFYKESHGFRINYEISAVLLKDIFQNMKDMSNGRSSVVGNIRFAHEETIPPLLTLLGFADNTDLRSVWNSRVVDERKFRTSHLAMFMANLEFRLYKKKDNTYYVVVRINEQQMQLPGCESVFCELRKFETLYRSALGFSFDKACAI